MDLISIIKSNVEPIDVANHFGLTLKETPSAWVTSIRTEKYPSLYIYKDSRRGWVDHGGSAYPRGGDCIHLWMAKKGVDMRTAIREMIDEFRLDLDSADVTEGLQAMTRSAENRKDRIEATNRKAAQTLRQLAENNEVLSEKVADEEAKAGYADKAATLKVMAETELTGDLVDDERNAELMISAIRIYGGESGREDADTLTEELTGERANEQVPQAKDRGTGENYLANLFKERECRKGREPAKTGIKGLDMALGGGLNQGLYIIGAPSSVGKTTLALQMADELAAHGRDVAFFTMEQSGVELVAKSLSRLTTRVAFEARKDLDGIAMTAGEILFKEFSDAQNHIMAEAVYLYADYGKRITVFEGRKSAEEVRTAVQGLVDRGLSPVVFVDYLQILAPKDPRMSDKQAVDATVTELRGIARDFNLPLIAISSIRRGSYEKEISEDDFKESGGIEYSADVLMALQSADPAKMAEEKTKDQRKVKIKILKNRLGAVGSEVFLTFWAKYGLFTEMSEQERRNTGGLSQFLRGDAK